MKPTSRLRQYSKKTCSLDDREEIIIVIVVLNSVTELLKSMKGKESESIVIIFVETFTPVTDRTGTRRRAGNRWIKTERINIYSQNSVKVVI
ncbi:hypothetical protein P9J64_01015 [Deltaproteobacteria bacterium IMCC39524]|nr:hypothetical protein [Deltaproteobacteria bacterium IMCC39524]